MNRTYSTIPIGELFASDIFGQTEKKPTVEKLKNNGAITAESRASRCLFTDLVPKERIKAIHPYITKEAFAATMDNYRIYIAQYNERIRKLNREIDKYNSQISEKITELQKPFYDIFIKRYFKKTQAKEYNELAEEFNTDRGFCVKKKKHQTVKYATELAFQQMLYVYSVQLAKQTNAFISLGVSIQKELTGADLGSYIITSGKRNGESAIDVCKQTIRNHRVRLEEAGVLLDYTFRGSKKGVELTINENILTIFEGKTTKIKTIENQRLTPAKHEVFKDNYKDNTRTIKKNIKKRETETDFSKKDRAFGSVVFYSFLQEHLEVRNDSQDSPAEKNVNVSEDSSEKLIKLIEHPQELAEKLTAGDYNNYTPVDIRILYRESMYGTLTKSEFNELIIGDFFKTAAKYYRNHSVFIGSWKKAINNYLEKVFWVNNGNDKFLYNKQLMVDKLSEFRWRLANSEKFYRKTGIKRLFPSDYFDFTRKSKQEIGFEYTKNHWQKHQKYMETKTEKTNKILKNAEIRKTNTNFSKKYDAHIRQFFNNRISFNELYSYVENNLPKNYLEKLTSVLLKTSEKYNIINH